MSDEERKGPTHRVSFAAFQRDDDGERKLGSAREIGAVWERKDRPGEGILRFDHTPREDGIYFVRDLNAAREAKEDAPREAPKAERQPSRSRSRDSGRER